jgi:ubiquinone/menaquinone biosynthesis C-methylase UbiE
MPVHHPVFARLYARLAPRMDAEGMGEHRRALLAGLSGDVVEVGAGSGLNFTHYPSDVTSVLAVEPEPYLRHLAHQAAATAPVPVVVVGGEAGDLPAPDRSFDAAVASLVLCSIHDQVRGLREIARVLRPGGELRFLEHVRAGTRRLARVQDVLDATVWPWVAGGCHAGRDTVAAIEGTGFTIERLDRFTFPVTSVPMPTSPHVRGVAVRAGTS